MLQDRNGYFNLKVKMVMALRTLKDFSIQHQYKMRRACLNGCCFTIQILTVKKFNDPQYFKGLSM